MAKVIYKGNGLDVTGDAPQDSNTYAAGATVYVAINDSSKPPHQQDPLGDQPNDPSIANILTGQLTRPGAIFLCWNTVADGSGTVHGWPVDLDFKFPKQTGDLTLYAQWVVTTGLKNGGVTAHYAFYYDERQGGPGGLEPARTNELINHCEDDFDWMQTQFTTVDKKTKVDITKASSLPITVQVTAIPKGGAQWGNGGKKNMTVRTWEPNASASRLRYLLVAEVVELFMEAQNKGWGFTAVGGVEESVGEALSIFLAEQFQLVKLGATSVGTSSSVVWLNTSPRLDYVNTPSANRYGVEKGCSLLFIYYLFHQLGFEIRDIIANAPGLDSSGYTIGPSCLRGVYQNLTADTSDPFPYFASLLAVAYPPDQVANIPGPNSDDPWPLGSLSFLGAKDTWGYDETNDLVTKGKGKGNYPNAFFLALDGFSRNVVGGSEPATPTIDFGGATTALSSPPSVFYQSPNLKIPQQICFNYDVNFDSSAPGNFPKSGETPAEVKSFIVVLDKKIPATKEFFFLAKADPYFTNVVKDPSDPTKLTVPWLSEDLRVFTATPGAPPASKYQYPVPKGPQFVENSPGGAFDFNGAYKYIQDLLEHLNEAYGDPLKTDPFDPKENIIPQQQTEFTADSSVTPFSTIGGNTYNNYSFAIARVRLKGSQGKKGQAEGVKVFFRLWGTETADTEWDPNTTYLSKKDGGTPLWPLAPADNHTIPFFATSAQPNFTNADDPEFKTGGFTDTGANNLTITIQQHNYQWAYFGCFLNVNDPDVNVKFPGTHHCLVAEIAYADAPIKIVGGSVPTPESSDQLAQRNLQVTTSDNPGPPSAHRIPQTFDVRPSAPPPTSGPLTGRPDELMIDWGEVPPGSTARIYWPAVPSAEVIKLASWMYGVHPLTAADAHTIEVKTIKGVTFVPIPQGKGPGFAGLFTVNLPETVTTGQEFDIVIRRIGKRPRRTPPPAPPPTPPPATPAIALPEPGAPAGKVSAEMVSVKTIVADKQAYERYIVGSFQVKIPVSTREAMLPAEETTLAILKARLEAMSKTDRWYPVLLRYIEQIAGRVNGLGGDADAIPASLDGYRRRPVRRPCEEELEEFTGKVCEVVFNCYGDFVAFVVDDCCEHRTFESREKGIGDLVLRALKERLAVMIVTAGKERRIVRLVVKG